MGFYDLLLCIDHRPVIMLELKKPGLKLTEDDRNQGISYARLTNPITPETVITNGYDVELHDTLCQLDKKDETLHKSMAMDGLCIH